MKAKDYNFKTTNIKGKEYVEVSERLKFLSDEFNGNYSINTNYEFYPDLQMFVCKAELKINYEGTEQIYTGLAQEIIGDGYINKTSALENCETSAVGRACAMAGIGIIDSIASVDEITKAKNREKRTPAKLDLSQVETKLDADMVDNFKTELYKCTSPEQIKGIWDKNPELHNDKLFRAIINHAKKSV